jgi:type I restriction enzyme M protein
MAKAHAAGSHHPLQSSIGTLLRLPTGIFYAGGVKANVLFFDKKPGRPEAQWTSRLWVYDLRTGQHFTLKRNRLQRHHLDEFVSCYRPGQPRESRRATERFRPYTYEELLARNKVDLDITWLRDPSLDDADALLPPEVIAREIVNDLEAALSEFAAIAEVLERMSEDASDSSHGDAG